MTDSWKPDEPLIVQIRCGAKDGKCWSLLAEVYNQNRVGHPYLVVFRDTERLEMGRIPADFSGELVFSIGCWHHAWRRTSPTERKAGQASLKCTDLKPAVLEAQSGKVVAFPWTPW